MPDLGQFLAAALIAPLPPAGGPDLVRYAGGRRALAEAISGLPGPPKRADYGDDQDRYERDKLRWRAASRRAQRADDAGAAGKQRRSGITALSDVQRRDLQLQGSITQARAFRRSGMNARMIALVVVPSPRAGRRRDEREKHMPSGGPPVHIPPAGARRVMDAFTNGGLYLAAGHFLEEFFEAYGMPDAEIEDVTALKVWPASWPEPPIVGEAYTS